MRQKRKSRLWWWLLLLIVASAGFVGYLVASKLDDSPQQPLIAEQLSSVEKKELSGEPAFEAGEKTEKSKAVYPVGTEQLAASKSFDSEARDEGQQDAKADRLQLDCFQLESNVLDFFRYLDGKQYVQNLEPDIDTYSRFKTILKKLAENAPIPAGEGRDSAIIIHNIYHFYRILDRQDIGLLRRIIRNEKETIELTLHMFYQWLVSGDRCPSNSGLRPSMELVYRYAGFFINTTGGRAYLFRRSTDLRLLMSYYCLLLVNKADRIGRNNYGIDIFPYISQIREEIELYPNFQLQREYVNRLIELESYYADKR